jgi:predicted ferric reductase/Ca2+-binding EF-hand superfamily protein
MPDTIDDKRRARERFEELAGGDDQLTKSRFAHGMSIKDSHAARQLFALFDADSDGAITLEEYCEAFDKLVRGTEHEKLDLLFRMHDTNGDGVLDRKEVERMMLAGMASYSLELPKHALDRLVDALFQEAAPDGSSPITREAFGTLVRRFPGVLTDLSTSESARVLTGSTRTRKQAGKRESLGGRLKDYLETRTLEAVFVGLFFGGVGALFVAAMVEYAQQGASFFVQIARGGGAALELCGALLLVPMLRSTMTWLRRQRIGRFIPLDHTIGFHALVGYTAFCVGLVHTAAHFANYVTVAGGAVGIVQGVTRTAAGASGLGLLVAFSVMIWFARPAIRRSGRFEAFYASHLLYLLWFPLMLIHGPTFWIWASAPLLGYAIERVLRARQSGRECEVLGLHALGSGVSHLLVAPPPGWSHDAGDYVFLKIPSIAPHEWHPFTISSAAECNDRLECHVRTAGNWTRALYRRAESGESIGKVYVDGPFGTPSAHIFDAERVILVGGGIGVTPFAAILQSIQERNRNPDNQKPVPKTVDFVWLAREQYAFEWFTQRLATLEREPTQTALRYHLYMTGTRVATTTASLALAREILHSREERDFLTGLAAHTEFGHPNWSALLKAARTRAGDEPVELFYCGPLGLIPKLRAACRKHDIGFRHEVF